MQRGAPLSALTPVLLCALTAVLLAGCGSGGNPPSGRPVSRSVTTSAVTSSTTTRTESGRPPSRAQARAFAKAVNLRLGDVPGFKAKVEPRERESKAERQIAREAGRCIGGSAEAKGIAKASSPSFERKSQTIASQSVSSEVNVALSEAQASRQLATIKSERTGACLAHFLGRDLRLLKLHGAHMRGLRVGRIAAPASGFGWRVKLAIVVRNFELPMEMQFLGFRFGRAEVSLSVIALPGPFPIATERRLVKLLMQRAKTQPL